MSAVVLPPSRSNTSIESWPGGLDPPQVVQAAVAGDAVEPRARVDGTVVGADRVEGRGEDLLEHVLGVLARGEHVTAEREQPRLVALDQSLERAVVAAADESHQALVRLEPEQGRAPCESRQPCRLLKCRGFQVRKNPYGGTPRGHRSSAKVALAEAVGPPPVLDFQRARVAQQVEATGLNPVSVWVRIPPRALIRRKWPVSIVPGRAGGYTTRMAKFLFTPVSIIGGLIAGALSRKIFDQVWGLIDSDEPPGEQAPRRDAGAR